MTSYAGETVTFKTSATQIDDANTILTDTDVTSTEIRIFDAEGTEILAATPLTWNATDQKWRYSWTTTTAGKYEAKIRLIGATFDTWEYQKVSIKEDKFP